MASRTPLFDAHREAGARFIEFGGWEMPLQYAGIVEEHLAVRQAAGLFDVSHMGKLFVEGPGVHAALDRLSANDVPTRPGRARYTFLLREDGTILDDAIVTCLSADRYFVVCNAGPRPAVLAWLASHVPPDVRVRDATTAYLCLALQGPRAPEILGRLTLVDVIGMKPFAGAVVRVSGLASGPPTEAPSPLEMEGWGSPASGDLSIRNGGGSGDAFASGGTAAVLVTRTGYTGEPGFELFPPADRAREAWDALLAAGRDLGLRPVGLGARDTLRLEKGYLLSGQDFDGRQTPLEVNGAWVVKWDRSFLGRDALEAQRTRGDHPRLVGLKMEDRGVPRHGCRILAGPVEVGRVTSGTMSPFLRVGIALASVGPAHARVGTGLHVEIRGSPHPARVAPLPFL